MKLSIKTRLLLGVGLQFFFIVTLVVTGILSVQFLIADTRNILKANYDSVEYCRNMSMALDMGDGSSDALPIFQKNLELQRNNVTEPGEQALTDSLALAFPSWAKQPSDLSLQVRIRKSLHAITQINMEAIRQKSEVAQKTGKQANVVMGTVGTLSFIISLVMLFALPSSIADPIKALNASIKQIANKNYAWRIDPDQGGEFGELAKSFNTMAAKLEDYESSNLSRMLFEKRRIEAIINQMPAPIIGMDENKSILFAKDAALQILNLRLQDLMGKTATEAALRNDLLRTLLQGSKIEGQNPITKPEPLKIYADGKESFFEKETLHVTVTAIGETEEKHIGDVIILQNITPFKELDTAKTNFIATVSHEFKTPISAIKMSLQLLKNEKVGLLNEEQRGLIASIQDDAERLLKITHTLLDLTQVESGQIHLNIHPADISEILQYALDATKVQAEQKNIHIDATGRDLSRRVFADKEKTAWVLTNLISNAIRYSYEHATVYLATAIQEGLLRISVRDTGQGVAPQYQQKIFERYFRIPGTIAEGTGLGLAISKEFVEAQGGRIGMESEFGAGSTFWVELKLER